MFKGWKLLTWVPTPQVMSYITEDCFGMLGAEREHRAKQLRFAVDAAWTVLTLEDCEFLLQLVERELDSSMDLSDAIINVMPKLVRLIAAKEESS